MKKRNAMIRGLGMLVMVPVLLAPAGCGADNESSRGSVTSQGSERDVDGDDGGEATVSGFQHDECLFQPKPRCFQLSLCGKNLYVCTPLRGLRQAGHADGFQCHGQFCRFCLDGRR